MISWMLVGGLAFMPTAASGCSASIQPIFDVVLAVQPVSIGSTIHVSDLAALAAQKNVPLRHPAYGYYISTFGYTIRVLATKVLLQSSG